MPDDSTIPMRERALKLLPAWFVERMIDNIGDFAFLLTTGEIVEFVTIAAVRQDVSGALWIDVVLAAPQEWRAGEPNRLWRLVVQRPEAIARWRLVQRPGATKWRLVQRPGATASIQAAHVVAAVDLNDDDNTPWQPDPSVASKTTDIGDD